MKCLNELKNRRKHYRFGLNSNIMWMQPQTGWKWITEIILSMNWKWYYNTMCPANFFYCCQSRNSLCLVVALRWYIKYEQSVKLIIRHTVINREGSRLDLTDVQSISELKLLLDAFICWQEYNLWQTIYLFFLPALCIIITLVYFFPKKVRWSALSSAFSSLNSLSHSPEQTAKHRHFE